MVMYVMDFIVIQFSAISIICLDKVIHLTHQIPAVGMWSVVSQRIYVATSATQGYR